MKSPSDEQMLDRSALHLLHRAGQQAEVLFAAEAAQVTGAVAETVDGLTPRQFAVLLSVAGKEDISQTGLVETTGIDRSTLADIVRRLVQRGLLSRKRTKQDARMYAVRLTGKGEKLLDAARPVATKTDSQILSVLAPKDRTQFVALLRDIVTGLDKAAAKDAA